MTAENGSNRHERHNNEREQRRREKENEKHELELEAKRQKLQHEQDLHEAEMAEKEAGPQFQAAQLALLGSLGELLPTLQELAMVFTTKYEFGDDNAIRAAACGLIKKAALKSDSPEAMKEAAESLLNVIHRVPVPQPAPPAKDTAPPKKTAKKVTKKKAA